MSRARRQSVTPPPDRRVAPAGLVVLAAGVLLAGAGLVVHDGLARGDAPVEVGSAVAFSDLQVTVTSFERRIDGVAGVNSAGLPMSGPAMPMGMRSFVGGSAAQDMSGMPGMAGMLHAGQERVDVRLEVRNDGDDGATLAADSFWLSSRGERVPLLLPTTSDVGGRLVPGFRMTGMLTFVVPEGTSPLVLHYADDRDGVLLDASSGERGAGHGTAPGSQHGGAAGR